MVEHRTSRAERFHRKGYSVARNLFSRETASLIRQYMDVSLRAGRMSVSLNDVTDGQFEQYGAILSETLLEALRSKIELKVGCDLHPTYSFWRVYEKGAQLRRHVDRKACEVSVSVAIAVEPKSCDWPLSVRDLLGNEQSISLKAGDGLIYMGCNVPHWRDEFIGLVQYQMFLHYVRKQGPYAKYALDGRSGLAMPPIT